MTNIKEFSKNDLADLIRDNPTAALEYAWQMRQTFMDCNKRRMKADSLNAAAEDALLAALVYVEDALADPAFKAGAVRADVNKIRAALEAFDNK